MSEVIIVQGEKPTEEERGEIRRWQNRKRDKIRCQKKREKKLLILTKEAPTEQEREWLERENARVEKRRMLKKKNREKNAEKERARLKKYRVSRTKEQKLAATRRRNAWAKQRCATNPAFACLTLARCRVGAVLKDALNGTKKKPLEGRKGRFEAYFGCDKETLVSYIESKFRDGMTWENRGKVWELDHIVPLRGGFGNLELLMRMNHYRNLQPLTVEENRRKHDSMPEIWPEGVPFTYEEVTASYEKYLSEKVKTPPKTLKKTKAVSIS